MGPIATPDALKLTKDQIAKILYKKDPRLLESYKTLSADGREWLQRSINELAAQGRSVSRDFITQMDYEREPVDMLTFLRDPQYLGYLWNATWPRWRIEFEHIGNPANKIHEVILSGAIGLGKTRSAIILILYKIYRLSCLRKPAEFHGLTEGDPIIFGVYNATLKLAKDVGYGYLKAMLEKSPYFKDIFPHVIVPDGIQFPKNMRVEIGSKAFHVLGQNLFGIAIDEMNDHQTTKKEALAKKMDQKGGIHALVTETARRLESRFMHRGEIPGIIVHISSAKTSTSYLEIRKREVVGNPGVYIVDGPQWDFQPTDRFSGETFRMSTGNKFRSPKILLPDEEAPKGCRVITVPVEHKHTFKTDPLGSIRDIAGIATESIQPFFPRAEVVLNAQDPTKLHPFINGRGADSGKPIYIDLGTPDTIQSYVDEDLLFTVRNSRLVPKHYPNSPRYIHCDLGRNEDALGLSMVHPTKAVSRTIRKEDGSIVRQTEITLGTDFSIQIQQKDTEVDWGKVRDFILWLREKGFNIQKVGFDSPASADSIQMLQKAGMPGAMYQSVDKKDEPYQILKTIYNEIRLTHPENEVLLNEILSLEINELTNKIDHPPGGSKDVADSLCGAVYLCINDEKVATYLTTTDASALGRTDKVLAHVKNLMANRGNPRG